MDQVCPVCRQQQGSWSHLCQEQRDVVHAEQFRDFLQNSNPLDRLSHDDYMEIMWGNAARSSSGGWTTTCRRRRYCTS